MRNILIFFVSFVALCSSANSLNSELFKVTATGKVLSITTNSSSYYATAGISIITSGYKVVSGCNPNPSSGYCIFGVGDTQPAKIALSGDKGIVEFKLCLNGNTPVTCQIYSAQITSKDLYVTNMGATGESGVQVCSVETDGTLKSCAVAGNAVNNFNGPASISINPITNIAYVVNYPGTSISVCPVKADGKFMDCIQNVSFNFSYGGSAINPTGTILYVTNYNNNTVDACDINRDGTLGACVDTGAGTGSTLSPYGMALNKAGTIAYVVNLGTSANEVALCLVSGKTFSCSNSNGAFASPIGVAFSKDESQVYVSNTLTSPPFVYPSISLCSVATDHTLSCLDSGYSGSSSLWGILVDGANAYISNPTDNTLTLCSISSDPSSKGQFTACGDSGAGAIFNSPVFMSLSN